MYIVKYVLHVYGDTFSVNSVVVLLTFCPFHVFSLYKDSKQLFMIHSLFQQYVALSAHLFVKKMMIEGKQLLK